MPRLTVSARRELLDELLRCTLILVPLEVKTLIEYVGVLVCLPILLTTMSVAWQLRSYAAYLKLEVRELGLDLELSSVRGRWIHSIVGCDDVDGNQTEGVFCEDAVSGFGEKIGLW